MAHSTYGVVFSVYLCAHVTVENHTYQLYWLSLSVIHDGHLAVCWLDKAHPPVRTGGH